MKQNVNSNAKGQGTAEEQLFRLIQEAGEDARARKRDALVCHFRKLQAAIHEAMSQQQGSVQT